MTSRVGIDYRQDTGNMPHALVLFQVAIVRRGILIYLRFQVMSDCRHQRLSSILLGVLTVCLLLPACHVHTEGLHTDGLHNDCLLCTGRTVQGLPVVSLAVFVFWVFIAAVLTGTAQLGSLVLSRSHPPRAPPL